MAGSPLVTMVDVLEKEFDTDSREDVRLRLAGDMALAAVRYGTKNWMRADRHRSRPGDAETLIAEVAQAFDALPGALTLTVDTPSDGT